MGHPVRVPDAMGRISSFYASRGVPVESANLSAWESTPDSVQIAAFVCATQYLCLIPIRCCDRSFEARFEAREGSCSGDDGRSTRNA
jgi:hypothetical protein